MRVTSLKLGSVVVCVLGSALVAFAAGKIPKTGGLFVLGSVLPVLISLPTLVVSSRPSQVWVCLVLSAAAAVGGFYQYNSIATAPDPFAMVIIWVYPMLNSVVVLVLLLVAMVLVTHFRLRRGEV